MDLWRSSFVFVSGMLLRMFCTLNYNQVRVAFPRQYLSVCTAQHYALQTALGAPDCVIVFICSATVTPKIFSKVYHSLHIKLKKKPMKLIGFSFSLEKPRVHLRDMASLVQVNGAIFYLATRERRLRSRTTKMNNIGSFCQVWYRQSFKRNNFNEQTCSAMPPAICASCKMQSDYDFRWAHTQVRWLIQCLSYFMCYESTMHRIRGVGYHSEKPLAASTASQHYERGPMQVGRISSELLAVL